MGRADLEARRRRIDEELDQLACEQEHIEPLVAALQRRVRHIEESWARLIEERDAIDRTLWQRAAPKPESPGRSPPVAVPRPPLHDLAPQAWPLDAVSGPVPVWITDSHTLTLTLPDRRPMPRPGGPEDGVEPGAPRIVTPTTTAPLWRRAPRRGARPGDGT